MTDSLVVATAPECVLCGGPCRESFRLPPIHLRYPFLPPEVVLETHPEHDQPPKPEPKRRRPKGEDTAKRPSEDRMRRPEEDRS